MNFFLIIFELISNKINELISLVSHQNQDYDNTTPCNSTRKIETQLLINPIIN